MLLEAGKSDRYLPIDVPGENYTGGPLGVILTSVTLYAVGYLHCIGNPRTDWGFKTAEEPGLGGKSLGYPRGKVLGGCSSINVTFY